MRLINKIYKPFLYRLGFIKKETKIITKYSGVLKLSTCLMFKPGNFIIPIHLSIRKYKISTIAGITSDNKSFKIQIKGNRVITSPIRFYRQWIIIDLERKKVLPLVFVDYHKELKEYAIVNYKETQSGFAKLIDYNTPEYIESASNIIDKQIKYIKKNYNK